MGGFVAGLLLIQEQQEIRERAAVPDGDATASVMPTSGNFDVGDSFPVSVYFNTGGIPINGIEVELFYQYSGASPEVVASNIEINPTLLATGNWTCPVRDISASGGRVSIQVACANIAADGFSSTTDTLLATFDLTITRQPQVDPVVVRFDPAKSVITAQATGQDILLIPQSQGSFSVAESGPVPTVTLTPEVPTPTTAPAAATVTPAVSPTITATATPTLVATATPTLVTTATATPTLMDAGVSQPTILALALAIFVILGALMLAL